MDSDEDFGSEDDELELGVQEGDEEEESIQLGFLAPYSGLLSRSSWGAWDGGKVGGRPVWLDPKELPSPSCLVCLNCAEPLSFLLQVYCPLDSPPNAFHRTLYLFCCRQPTCFDRGGVKCLRGQLSQHNDFYAADPDIPSPLSSSSFPTLCSVCGAKNVCAKCKAVFYCSRSHQKIDWKNHKTNCCRPINASLTPTSSSSSTSSPMALFPEFDIVVEVEELRNTAEDDIIQATAAKTAVWEGAEEVEEGDQEDAKLSQKDYNAALGNQVVDPNYVRFLTRVRRGGEHQILRYCRWPATEKNQRVAPLYMHSANAVLLDPTNKERTSAPRIAAKDVPNCSNCGAERRFEFQVMPQLLHYLGVDKRVKGEETEAGMMPEGLTIEQQKLYSMATRKSLDWGSIDVYTCTASCEKIASKVKEVGGGRYLEEFVFVQPPLLLMSTTAAPTSLKSSSSTSDHI